ncbi:MAG TPA: hypothetical protein PKW66_24290, partial [Polyangiaceae bacterium]|nr:hypothetical protein [Polyangiaceae bacterium]
MPWVVATAVAPPTQEVYRISNEDGAGGEKERNFSLLGDPRTIPTHVFPPLDSPGLFPAAHGMPTLQPSPGGCPPVATPPNDNSSACRHPSHDADGRLAAPVPEPESAEPTMRPLEIPFAQLVQGISEKDAYYFSDNYVSNETAFLQVAPELPKAVA